MLIFTFFQLIIVPGIETNRLVPNLKIHNFAKNAVLNNLSILTILLKFFKFPDFHETWHNLCLEYRNRFQNISYQLWGKLQ